MSYGTYSHLISLKTHQKESRILAIKKILNSVFKILTSRLTENHLQFVVPSTGVPFRAAANFFLLLLAFAAQFLIPATNTETQTVFLTSIFLTLAIAVWTSTTPFFKTFHSFKRHSLAHCPPFGRDPESCPGKLPFGGSPKELPSIIKHLPIVAWSFSGCWQQSCGSIPSGGPAEQFTRAVAALAAWNRKCFI